MGWSSGYWWVFQIRILISSIWNQFKIYINRIRAAEFSDISKIEIWFIWNRNLFFKNTFANLKQRIHENRSQLIFYKNIYSIYHHLKFRKFNFSIFWNRKKIFSPESSIHLLDFPNYQLDLEFVSSIIRKSSEKYFYFFQDIDSIVDDLGLATGRFQFVKSSIFE